MRNIFEERVSNTSTLINFSELRMRGIISRITLEGNNVRVISGAGITAGIYDFLQDNFGNYVISPQRQWDSAHNGLALCLKCHSDARTDNAEVLNIENDEPTHNIRASGELIINQDGSVAAWSLASGTFPRNEEQFRNVGLPVEVFFHRNVMYALDGFKKVFFDEKGLFKFAEINLAQKITEVEVPIAPKNTLTKLLKILVDAAKPPLRPRDCDENAGEHVSPLFLGT